MGDIVRLEQLGVEVRDPGCHAERHVPKRRPLGLHRHLHRLDDLGPDLGSVQGQQVLELLLLQVLVAGRGDRIDTDPKPQRRILERGPQLVRD
jgi:hypothetical protein